jgi:hypothetical protein
LSFSYSGFALMLFCRYILSPSQREPFLRSASVGQDILLIRRVIAFTNRFYSQSSAQNSITEFKTQIVIMLNF